MNSSFTKEAIDCAIDKLTFGITDNQITCKFHESTPDPIRVLVVTLLGFLNSWKTLGMFNGGVVHFGKLPPFPTPMGINELKNIAYRVILNQRFPTHIKLDITYKCQCKCLHCGISARHNPQRKELSTDEWKGIIDQCISFGANQFHILGGEPFLRDDLVEIVGHVDKSKATCNIITNGLSVTEKLIKQLKDAGLYFLGVSIDYADEGMHDRNRGTKGSYKEAINAIRLAREAGLFVEVNSYISRGEAKAGKLPLLVDMASRLSAHVLTLVDYHPTSNNIHNMGSILSKEEKRFLLNSAPELMEKNDLLIAMYFFQTDEDACEQFLSIPVLADLISGCPAARRMCSISAYGDVMPCSFAPFTFGNVRSENIAAIFDRMCSTDPYDEISTKCRILDPAFRAKYIDNLDGNAVIPVPFPGLKNPAPGI